MKVLNTNCERHSQATFTFLLLYYNRCKVESGNTDVHVRIPWDTYHSINDWVSQCFLIMTTLRLSGAYSQTSVAITGVCNYNYMNGIKYWYVIIAQRAQPSQKMRSKANFSENYTMVLISSLQ